MKLIFPSKVSSLRSFLLVILLGMPALLTAIKVQAASPITASGLGTQIGEPLTTPGGQTQYNITGGTRPGGGVNLFHSFGEFGVPTNNIANFLNDSGFSTSNILGRVTGGNVSSIFGMIQTTGFEGANLFLMNPAGFLFGPNAAVSIGGMMTFTTADYLTLRELGGGNAGIFHANPIQTSVLTSAPVAAFGFIGSNPNAITFEGGQLTVVEGTGLRFVGGDINLLSDALDTPITIAAPGRPIEMVSVAGAGEVDANTGIPSPEVALGSITLGQGTTLTTLGSLDYGNGGGGAVSIRGGQLVATGTNILTSPHMESAGHGGEVTITTTGSAAMTNLAIDTRSQSSTGNGGAVTVAASDLTLQDSSIVTRVIGDESAISPATGEGGAVTVTGTNSVTLTRSFINMTTNFSNGDGGSIAVTSPLVALEDTNLLAGVLGNGSTPITASGGSVSLGGPETNSVSMIRSLITTESFETSGNSGAVTITGHDITIGGNGGQTIVTSTHATSGNPDAGNGGEIVITGTNVTFTDQAWIDSVADSPGTFSQGGNVHINSTQSILIDNGTIFSTTTTSEGNAGNIDLASQQVTIRGQSNIGSAALAGGSGGTITVTGTENIALEGGSVITTNADFFSEGPVGHIVLNTPHLAITEGSALASQNFGDGPGGTVTVQGTSGPAQSVLISGSGGIFTDTASVNLDGTILGNGTGGNIFVHAQSLTLEDGSLLSAGTTGIGNGGNILVESESVNIQTGAQITSSSSLRQVQFFEGEVISPPTGNAGTITVEGLASPAQSVLIDGFESGVFTDTQGTGAGGNIFVNANSVTLSNGGTLSATTSGSEPSATGGTITVNANTVNLNAGGTMTAASTGAGAAGDITVQGLSGRADAVLISGMDENFNPSGIFTDTQGTGAGGNIFVNANSVTLQDGSTFSAATAGTGDAGNINIAADALTLNGFSNIRANTEFGSQGKGGNVTAQVREASLNGGSTISTGTFGLGDAGEITIQATERITMSDFSGISSFAFDFGTGAGNAGLIHLTAPTIQLNGGSINSLSQGPGNAGEIILDANTIMMGGNQNSIVSQTGGTGRGGDISIQGLGGPGNRTSDFTISDGSTITSSSSGDGRAGDISILTERITLTNSGMNSSAAAAGNAGNITIDASESVHVSTDSLLLSSSSLDATGNAGQITILTPSLTVDGGGVVSTSTNGTGNAGSITVNATSVNLLSGGQLSSTSSVDPLALNSPLPTGSAGTVTIQGLANPAQSVLIDGPGSGVFTDTSGTGAGGNIVVNANAITLQNGGTLSAITSGSESSAAGGTITVNAGQVQVNSGGILTASTTGAGAGGSININASSTFAMNGGTVSSSATEAAGGDINISTGQSVTLDNGSQITASSNGDGNAGNILINAGQQYRSINSSVTTKAEEASGGNITVLATGLVHLTNSELNASVEGSSTTVGGNILIDPVYVILENSQVLAQATQGQGGNINIFYSGAFLVDPSSLISASSQFGQSGTVTIQSPISPASGKIIPLGQKPLIVTSLLSQRCAALAGGNISSFTIAGRESLPAEPGSWLSSPIALSMSESEDGTVREADGTMADETPLLSLRKIAPPGFLTHAFAVDWSPGCSS